MPGTRPGMTSLASKRNSMAAFLVRISGDPRDRPHRCLDAYLPAGLFRPSQDARFGGRSPEAVDGAHVALRPRSTLPSDGCVPGLSPDPDAFDAADRGSGGWRSRGRPDASDERWTG